MDEPASGKGDGDEGAGGPLGRYMTVLELVAAFPDGVAMTDVCSLLQMPKATAHRMLAGLTRAGLAARDERTKTFRLGARLLGLMHSSVDEGWIATLARPHLKELAAERRETCYVTRLVGHRVFVVARESPETQWRIYVQPGYVMPAHAAAAAKAILAFQSDAVIANALRDPLPRLTLHTRTDRADVLADYAAVRGNGYATCCSEIDEGFGALAVPILQAGGAVMHSVGITGPVQRIMDADMPTRLASLKQAAETLAKALSVGAALTGHRPLS